MQYKIILTTNIIDVINIGANVFECWFTTSDLRDMDLTNKVKTSEDIGNVIQTPDLSWKQETMFK